MSDILKIIRVGPFYDARLVDNLHFSNVIG